MEKETRRKEKKNTIVIVKHFRTLHFSFYVFYLSVLILFCFRFTCVRMSVSLCITEATQNTLVML